MISNGNKNKITSDTWQCDNFLYNSYCVYLRIFNQGCIGLERITISVYGDSTNDGDLFALFSLKNSENKTDWFTFASDWDGKFKYKEGGIEGGVFIAPNCSGNLNNRNSIWNILDDINTSSPLSNRAPLAGGSINNWQLLTESRVGTSTSPIMYTIENDVISGQVKTYFSASTINPTNCTYKNGFDTQSGNDYVVIFLGDDGVIRFSEFDIDVKCEVCCVF